MNIRTISAIAVALAFSAVSVSAQRLPANFSDVYNPEIPSQVHICGKNISLDRPDMYERFDRELTSIAYTHGTTLLMIKRANRLFPEMAPILMEAGVPLDMLYLACVESTLDQRALSPAKAAGIWQFMPTTAKEFGLEVNDEVDERYNLEKATRAAAKYLKKSYANLGDWPSVMAAYNGGNARITSELGKQMQNTSLDLYLTEETSRYPYRIMAMKTILENPSKYGFHLRDDQLYQPRKYRTVQVSGPVPDWAEWAKKQGISYLTLREENPWIRSKKLTNKLGKSYTVRIPLPESMSRKTESTKTYNPDWTDR
ncbi:MAG: lytic transglycosylase domain-containing protein [Muribaculaceae bacterium]|nr:lytic transglycosylase domain-containing protein [Muribaculaceae bacterium]